MKAIIVIYLNDGVNLEELSADVKIENFVDDEVIGHKFNSEVLPIPKPKDDEMNFYNKGWNDCLKDMLGNMYDVDDIKKWRQENESNINN